MGIDAIGGAGHQSAQVLPGLDLQRVHLGGLYNEDLVHLVGQHLVQHPDGEGVPLHDLVQIGKQLGAGQASVAGEHAVGALAAYGQAGPVHMAHGDLQNGFGGAVVDGQGHIDIGDLDIAHNARAAEVQKLFILLLLLLRQGEAVHPV